MEGQRSGLYEPAPRFCHVAASVSDGSTDHVIVQGGETFEFYTSSDASEIQLASTVEQFDIHSEVWCQRTTEGTPHPGLSMAACTSFENHLFMYGVSVKSKSGSPTDSVLSSLDLNTLTWSQLCPGGTLGGPMRKVGCGLVHYHRDKLALIGGHGHPTDPTNQPGSSFIMNARYSDRRGLTNEIHVFDLNRGRHS